MAITFISEIPNAIGKGRLEYLAMAKELEANKGMWGIVFQHEDPKKVIGKYSIFRNHMKACGDSGKFALSIRKSDTNTTLYIKAL